MAAILSDDPLEEIVTLTGKMFLYCQSALKVYPRSLTVNTKKTILKSSIFFFLIMVLFGCSPKTARVVKAEDGSVPISNHMDVFARLDKSDEGRYGFSEFSFVAKENFIRLNDLVPLYPMDQRECSKGLGSEKDPLCSSDDNIFRVKTIDTGDVLKNTVWNAISGYATIGMGLAAYYTTEFDYGSYEKALTEALDGFDRPRFIEAVQSIAVSKKNKINNLNAEIERIRAKLELDANSTAGLVDMSGLYFGSKPPVTFKSDYLDEHMVDGHEEIWTGLTQLEQILEEKIYKSLDALEIKSECGSIKGYVYSTSGCDQVLGYYDSDPDEIVFNVDSKTKMTLSIYPKVEDGFISIEVDKDGDLVFKNKTRKYLKVESVSLYVNEDISSRTELGIELPPRATIKSLSLTSFDSYSNNLNLSSVTVNTLKNKITYALAAKYMSVDSGSSKSLFSESSKILAELSDM